MAIALEVGVGYLLLEFAAHTLEVLGALGSAGAVSSRALEPLLNYADKLLVLVKSYLLHL